MKARIFDLRRVIEGMPRKGQAKIRPQTEELHIVVGDLSRKIDRLRQECPAEGCQGIGADPDKDPWGGIVLRGCRPCLSAYIRYCHYNWSPRH
jgi:hypothetical protein